MRRQFDKEIKNIISADDNDELLFFGCSQEVKELARNIEKICAEANLSYIDLNRALYNADKELYRALIRLEL